MDDKGFIFAKDDTHSTGRIFSGGLPAGRHGFSTSTASSTSQISPEASSGTAPQANPIGRAFAPGHLPGILAFLDQLSRIGLIPLGVAVDDNGSDFVVPLTQGFAVKASFGQDKNMLVRNLQLILSADALQGKQSDIQYIDLRFGDRAYYKLKSSGAVSTPASGATQ